MDRISRALGDTESVCRSEASPSGQCSDLELSEHLTQRRYSVLRGLSVDFVREYLSISE